MHSRLLLVVALVVGIVPAIRGAPPTLTIPPTVTPAGDYATFTPAGDAASVVYVGLSGVDPFPSHLLRDARTFVLPVRGLASGSYRFAAVAASKEGDQSRADFVVVVGGDTTPPVPKTPDPPAGPQPGSLFFVVIRGDGPASAEFTRVMSDPAWDTIRRGGAQVKDYQHKEACGTLGLCLPAGTVLPVVVTLRVTSDGKTSRVVRAAIPLPTTSAGITDLPRGVTP